MALFVWGSNASQQLGLGVDDKEIYDVRQVEALDGQFIVDFSAGESHSLAVNEFGDVFAWGRGKEGQLGLGKDQLLVRTPQRVTELEGQLIKNVACGEMHSLALTVAGDVFMWGLLPETRQVRNDGVFDHATVSLAGMDQAAMSPRSLRGTMSDNIMSRLVRDSELVYEAVNMVDGPGTDSARIEDLGRRKVQTVRHACFVPRPCPSLARVVVTEIAAGFAHSLAVSACGAVFSCGYNDNGQLGTGSRRNSADFERVQALDGIVIAHVACGQQHSLACSRLEDVGFGSATAAGGVCYSWGLGILGQLGTGINISWLPMRVDVGEPVASVAAGSHHSVAVTHRGRVYSWGHSEYGQHGAGELFYDLQRGAHYFHPRMQESLAAQRVRVARVACSSHSTFALERNGSGGVFAWGWNAFGVLGVGKFQHSVHPQQVFGLRHSVATHVGAGSNHGAAIVTPRGAHYSLRYDRVLASSAFADVAFVLQRASGSGRGGGAAVVVHAHRVVVCARSAYLWGLLRAASASASVSTNNSTGAAALDGATVDADGEPGDAPEHGDDVDDSSLAPALVVDAFRDVDAQVFRAFLGFLYTQRVVVASHKRKALGALAQRVCHDELARECEDAWRRERAVASDDNDDGTDGASDERDNCSDGVQIFGRDMARMVLSPEFADVVFLWPSAHASDSVGGDGTDGASGTFERLPAHKAVLAQVDYFHTMFSGGFSEGAVAAAATAVSGPTPDAAATAPATPVHEIALHYMHRDGVSLTAFKHLLMWIYTGAFAQLQPLEPSELMDVFVGARRLGLSHLASMCELQLTALLTHLDADSVRACLDFADRFDARRLETLCRQVLARQAAMTAAAQEQKQEE